MRNDVCLRKLNSHVNLTPAAQADKVFCVLCKVAQPTQKVPRFGCPAQRSGAFVLALVIYKAYSSSSISFKEYFKAAICISFHSSSL